MVTNPLHRSTRVALNGVLSTRLDKPDSRVALFLTSNGVGLGHVTRLLALARRMSPGVRPVFVTLSRAVSIVRDAGFLAEYVPSRAALGADGRDWTRFFGARLDHLLAVHRPSVLVFDGPVPWEGLIDARRRHAELPWVWIRRGLWLPDVGHKELERESCFDLVVEPGELADAFDAGPTVARRGEAERVRPILLCDPEDARAPDAARRALGLDPAKPAALVTLGSDGVQDLAEATQRIARRLLSVAGLQVVVAEWLIARRRLALPAGARSLWRYPLAPDLAAFDFAVSSCGYNAFHELVAAGVPCAFAPMPRGRDDQAARARWAEAQDAGIHLAGLETPRVEAALERLLDADWRARVARRCRDRFPGNGAADAARIVETLLDDGAPA